MTLSQNKTGPSDLKGVKNPFSGKHESMRKADRNQA
jgi:hypothetical protein